jgi:peptidoglycan/LPS O-acetylase OafA/YrhL
MVSPAIGTYMKHLRGSQNRRAIFIVTGIGLIAFSAYTSWALFGLSQALGHENGLYGIYAFCAGLAVIGAWCIRVAYAYRRYERLLVAILATSCVIAALVCIVAPSRGIDIHFR